MHSVLLERSRYLLPSASRSALWGKYCFHKSWISRCCRMIARDSKWVQCKKSGSSVIRLEIFQKFPAFADRLLFPEITRTCLKLVIHPNYLLSKARPIIAFDRYNLIYVLAWIICIEFGPACSGSEAGHYLPGSLTGKVLLLCACVPSIYPCDVFKALRELSDILRWLNSFPYAYAIVWVNSN